ncbi:MAG: glycine/betaine transporter substrate-binding protein [Actinotalea sp.]|nr:glycine/betaine transporter substrate-binding protein [Actinotalea sp.]
MRAPHHLAVGALALAALLAGCGEAGSSGTDAPSTVDAGSDTGTETTATGCAPVAGERLIVLEDDKALQNTDNIIPAVNATVATPELLAALDTVSAALDTEALIELNRTVDVDRQTPLVAAEAYAEQTGLTADIQATQSGSLIVGAADFSENQTLGELYRIVLEAAGYDVTVQTIGNRELYAPALQSNEIQVVPEYAATMADFLNGTVNGPDADAASSSDLDETVTNLSALGEQVGIVFGTPSAAQDQNAFAVTQEFADTYDVATLTDLAEKCSGEATVLGGPAECPERPKCEAGLVEVYGFEAGSFSSLDAGGPLTKTALTTGEISVGLVFSSDGALGG